MTIRVSYFCPACKRGIARDVRAATPTIKSFCERTGRNVVMRLIRTPAARARA